MSVHDHGGSCPRSFMIMLVECPSSLHDHGGSGPCSFL